MTDPDPPIIELSYPLSETTPAYGGGDGLSVEQLSSIALGDTANSLRLTFPNHLGTHVDVPRHFFSGAPSITHYPPEQWIFDAPVVVDVEVGDGKLVGSSDVARTCPTGADLLILRTGHGRSRGREEYWQAGPGLSAELARWLRVERPTVRAVGMDLISVTSRLDRPAGRAAHRAFLDPEGVGDAIRLIEDMRLDQPIPHLARVLVVPLVIEDADGGPVTVWGFPGQPPTT
jgi:kynurenine formamidase